MIGKIISIGMSPELLKEPLLYKLVKDFDIIPTVRSAEVTELEAAMVLEITADTEEQLQSGIAYLVALGATVKRQAGDFIEG